MKDYGEEGPSIHDNSADAADWHTRRVLTPSNLRQCLEEWIERSQQRENERIYWEPHTIVMPPEVYRLYQEAGLVPEDPTTEGSE